MIKNKILILGVGNTLRRDDGIGPKVIECLQRKRSGECCDESCDNSALNCEIVDGGVDGLGLIDIISQYSRAIIVDAVDMGAAPATICVFPPESAVITIKSDTLSTHGIGLAEVIKLLPELGVYTKLTIIGLQPADTSFGSELTSVVAAKLDELVTIVLKEVAKLTRDFL